MAILQENLDKMDTSVFVQKPNLRKYYVESEVEGSIEIKNQKELFFEKVVLPLQKHLWKTMLIINSTIQAW